MKSPVFQITQDQLKDCMKLNAGSPVSEIERKAAKIIAEHQEALVAAWVAETGRKPSESVICHGYRDGHMRVWVETKDENDKRAVALVEQ